MKKYTIHFLLGLMLVSLTTITGYAQDQSEAATTSDPMAEKQPVQFYVDYATFQAAENKLLLEVYLMIPRTQLTFLKQDSLNRNVARGFVQVALAQHDSVKYLDRWTISDAVDSLSQIKSAQNIPDMSAIEAKPGDYTLLVQVIDLNADERGTYRQPISLHPFNQQNLSVSEIELASIVNPTQDNNETVFTKYNRDIVPNASLTFGLSTPIMYSYSEFYNLDYPSEVDSYKVEYKVMDLNGSPVKELDPVMRKKVGDSCVDIGGLNVVGLKSGSYFYRIKVTDLATGNVATRSKKFYVYKPGEKIQAVPQFADLGYDSMTEEEINDVFDMLYPITTDKDQKTFKNASLQGKQNFLTEFWKHHDATPETSVNEFRQMYMQRLSYVNEHFGNSQRPGYKSDRGRIWLTYGEPSEIQRNPVNLGGKPNQTWFYNSLEGGVYFIFVDRNGFGTYDLVHSTARNEINDPNWQRFINTSPTSSGNASQY